MATVINSLWNGLSRGDTNRGDGSEVVQCPSKKGEGNWNPTVVVEKTQFELRKSGITIEPVVGGPNRTQKCNSE